MKFRHLILLFLLPLYCFGQTKKQIDSLRGLIKISQDFYKEGEHDSSYHYAKTSYNLAKELHQDSLQLKIIGILCRYEPDIEKALS